MNSVLYDVQSKSLGRPAAVEASASITIDLINSNVRQGRRHQPRSEKKSQDVRVETIEMIFITSPFGSTDLFSHTLRQSYSTMFVPHGLSTKKSHRPSG